MAETHDAGPITLINVFEIRYDDVELFLQGWQERAQDFFQQSTHRSMHDFAVAAHPALYRVVIEAAAE
jgi:hypothetical protein